MKVAKCVVIWSVVLRLRMIAIHILAPLLPLYFYLWWLEGITAMQKLKSDAVQTNFTSLTLGLEPTGILLFVNFV
jgi:hypothetical protein